MISLRAAHAILVATSALLAAAFKTYDAVLLAMAVASVVFASLIVVQARLQHTEQHARR